MIPPQPVQNEMTFAPCVNCGHDAAGSGDLVKHTNTRDGHRFFTLHCQVCKCDKPAIQGKEVLVVEAKKDPEIADRENAGSSVNIQKLMADSRRKEILRLHEEGKTAREISDLLKVSPQLVNLRLQEEGISPRPKERSPEIEKKDPKESESKILLLEVEIENLKRSLAEAREQITAADRTIAELRSTPNDGYPGILRSKVMISGFEGYYDNQKKLISELIKEHIYHAGKGKSITMEVRQLEDLLRVTVEISGGPAE